jgi:hypothetical protein
MGSKEQTRQAAYVQHLKVQNAHAHAVQVFIEPWGEELSILPNVTYEVVAKGPRGDCLEVEFGEARITVWGWSGSIASVFHKGNLLRECQIPVPSTPQRRLER